MDTKVNPIEVLITADDYLNRLILGVQETSINFRSGEEDVASRSMIEIIDGIQWLVDVFMLTEDTQKVTIDPLMILPIVKQTNEALENLDYVYLSDLLEYEIVPILEDWKSKLLQTVGS